MDRRQFLGGAVAGAAMLGSTSLASAGSAIGDFRRSQAVELNRASFPRLAQERYLNAAGGTPLGLIAEQGLRRFEDFWRMGPAEGRGTDFTATMNECRARFARLIGALPEEIALVSCTKAGEQIVIDGIPDLRARGNPDLRTRGNVVTNDLHFTGSLHNLIGLRRGGMDVRIVRAADWKVSVDEMKEAIDANTRLVCVSLVSNINGHVEATRELAELAHARGALLYADIIQAAGIMPVDVRAMGIDFAACSSYKWLYGTHGAGFFYARKELQGSALQDNMFPGHIRHNYPPWIQTAEDSVDEFVFAAPDDASRYQPGHVSYLGYFAVNETLKAIQAYGVERLLQHSIALNQGLHAKIDKDRYELITPDLASTPIATYTIQNTEALAKRLEDAGVTVSLASNRMRISPAIYNNEDDIDRLLFALNG